MRALSQVQLSHRTTFNFLPIPMWATGRVREGKWAPESFCPYVVDPERHWLCLFKPIFSVHDFSAQPEDKLPEQHYHCQLDPLTCRRGMDTLLLNDCHSLGLAVTQQIIWPLHIYFLIHKMKRIINDTLAPFLL